MDTAKLKSDLISLLDGSASYPEVTELVHLSRAIIQSNLSNCRPSASRLCAVHGLTVTDLAYDSIAEAFTRNETGEYAHIRDFANSLRTSLAEIPGHELFMAFKSYLVTVADAHIARLYAYADPAGAKIHRNIRLHLKNSPTLFQERQFGALVVRPRNIESLDHCHPFPIDELEREFLGSASIRHTIPQLLDEIYRVLARQTRYRRSILLTDLVYLCKSVYLNDLDDEQESQIPLDGLSEAEIEEVGLQVDYSLKEKIFLTYIVRGKIELSEGEAMHSALCDMLRDWCASEGAQMSLYQYLREYLPMDEKKYEDVYRAKMEYLLKVTRQELLARLMKEL